MMQQIQTRCGPCSGTGYNAPPGDTCTACRGKCLVAEKKTFEVHIEPGMKQGSKIVLRGEAGCSEPGLAPGDVVLVVAQREHESFKRVNIDLVMEKKINLVDALCGCEFHVKHLDGRVLKVVMPPGKVVKPESFYCIKDEGMPVHGRPYQKGNIYVHFSVEFPDSLDAATIAGLRKIGLPNSLVANDALMETEDVEEVAPVSQVVDIEDELKSRMHMGKATGNDAYDSGSDDEAHGRGGQRVQCAQQ